MKYYFGVPVFLFASLVLVFADCAENKELNKQEKWQEIAIEVESWVDGLGYPIDPKIKETVIALNALGIPTIASCEGHLDHGLSHPWIDIDINTPEIHILETRARGILGEIKEKEQFLQEIYPTLSWNEICNKPEAESLIKLYQLNRDIFNKIELAQQELLKDLYFLIESFYKNHDSCYDNILFIQINSNFARILSIGGKWQRMRSDKEKEMKLNEYQEEMKKFTQFLKEYFYQECDS